ncbi:MAG: YibE/F family protein [Erysipelotrichaceae bacterium]|nr:YibE/F family protein [Erysipelotrichaceae bacterium]
MKKLNIKTILIYIVTILISLLISYFGSAYYTSQMPTIENPQYDSSQFHNAKITAVVSDQPTSDVDDFGIVREVVFKATISKGQYQHREITVKQQFTLQTLEELYPVEVGDAIILYRIEFGSNVEWALVSYQRENSLWLLAGLFILLIIVFGRMKGFNSIVSLGFTIYAIFFILIPAILANANIYLVSLGIVLYVTLLTFILLSGFTKKMIAGTLGCFGGIATAALIAYMWMEIMKMSGVLSDEYIHLILLKDDIPIDLRGIMFIAVVIGALGAVMDVSMSIASALEEIMINSPDITPTEVIKSGLNIGRDIMGTMSNTLILAYIGSALPFILLLIIYARPINLLANSEYIASEIMQAVAGSLGILFAMPITALITAALYRMTLKKTDI